MKTSTKRLGSCIAILAAIASTTAHRARADVDQGSAAIPTLVVSVTSLFSDAPGGPEASAAWRLAPGNRARLTLGAGSSRFPTLCASSSGGATFQDGVRVGWTIEGTLVSADADGARVRVRWERQVFDQSAVDVADFVREYEVYLAEGSRRVIDLVRPRSDTSCDGVAVALGLEFHDPPELEREGLDYDIWLVHRDAGGRELVERSRGQTLHGRTLEYVFPAMRHAANGRLDDQGPLRLELSGLVKGRLRPDGRIDLSIHASRTLREGVVGNGDGGSRQATVDDGETLELELPPVPERPDFERQHTALRVTVRRVR